MLRAKSINRATRAVAAAALLSGLVWLTAPAPAAAHAELVSSTPAANASLLESPGSLSMTFTEAVDPATASIQILDDRQRPMTGLGPVTVGADRLTTTVTLPKLSQGVYTVSYRVTSAVDGHVSAGIWAFLVDPTGSLPAPAVPTESSSPSADLMTVTARWLALVGGLVLLGIPLFWLVSGRPVLANRGARTVAPWGAIAVAGAIAFGALAVYLTLAARPFVEAAGGHPGHGAGGAIPLDFAAPFGSTPFATAMRLAEVGAALGFLIATTRFFGLDEARRRGSTPSEARDLPFLWLVAGAGALSLAGSSLAGHAAARGGVTFALLDWAHLVAVGAWVGTLPGLLLLAARARRGEAPSGTFGAALRRHSRVALAAAPIVALTGIANSPMVLGSTRALVGSDYGNVLLAKVGLFSIAVAIGSANYFLIRGRAFRRTLPLIGLELVVAALAVLAASTLVTIQPAAGRAPVLTQPVSSAVHLYGTADTSTVHVAVNLPEPGEQHYEVAVADATTSEFRTDVQRVILVYGAPPESGLPDQRVDLDQGAEPWLWRTSGAYTPLVGEWTLEVLVRRVGERDETASFDLSVSEPLPPVFAPPPDTGIGVPAPLAMLWVALPRGTAGWAVPIALLLSVAGVLLAERRATAGSGALLVGARLVLVALAVLAGVGVGSRAVAELANEPPPGASATLNPVAPTDDSTARGHDLYLANCAACHGLSGAGDGLTAASILPRPNDLAVTVPARTDGALAYLIGSGTVATRMPAFSTTLSERDRWDLVNYLRATWPRE